MKIISPIAIDMGAKNTGVYLNHFVQGEDPTTSGNSLGKTIVIDSQKITWSQVDRTQKRHQVRGNKRRKLAKRLLKLILTKGYGLTIKREQLEFLMGLLNRRGYTYLVEDLEQEQELIKQEFVGEYFVKNHSGFFKNADTFYDDFLILSNDIDKCRSLKGKLTLDKNSAQKSVANDKQSFADAYDNIKKYLDTQIKAQDEGHKYRVEYLKTIKHDINSDLLKPLLNEIITPEELSNLIGNISNLQLRILRKYFNDESMNSDDQWLPVELHQLFFKWIGSWHTKSDEGKQNRKKLLALRNKDILEILTTSNPRLTIPPYEDQNNRRPPKDLTLRLKPKSLDKHLKDWKEITQLLADNYVLPKINANIEEKINIQEELASNVREEKIKNKKQDTKERQILADTLHRILDRSSILDPYRIRLQVQFRHSNFKGNLYPKDKNNKLNDRDELKEKVEISYARLKSHIGEKKIVSFIQLAKDYYKEVDVAEQGLWSDSERNLFFRCNTNPPHKGNIQHRLVRHILREDFELNPETKKSEKLEQFKEECWNKKIKGNSTTKSLAGRIEETRKEYGNAFNYIATTIQKRRYVLESKADEITQEKKDRWDKYAQDHEDIISAIENADLVATEINDFFKHDKKEKYNNPYSIAQLYNHLESEISGFSKTDKWNTEENAWRDREQKIETLNKSGEIVSRTASNASRLTADSIRPFDGMLDRIISRQAYEIAQMKIKQIESLNIDRNDQLFVPIFMEQNRFAFEQSLHEIKGLNNIKKKTKERVEKGLKKQETQWQDKDSRIKKNTYCPYTDKQIKVGELDHIIPQSNSKKSGDVVFNYEANLIYCSRDGNDAKDNKRYTFDYLKPNYLKEIFNNHNKEQIQQNIKDFINGLDENDPISFHNLEDKEQNYLRHALFIPELDSKTFPILNTRYKTLVNGTQGYLGKQIRKLLQKKYPNVEVKTYQISAYEVSQLRDVLGAFNHDFAKNKGKQDAFSHVVDASLVLAAALQNNKIAEELKTTNTNELFKDYESKLEQGQWLKDLLPAQSDVQHIERKPKYRKNLSSTKIFKEGLYGERFMPILLNDGKLYYGFSLDNCKEIEPLKSPEEKQLQAHNKYFETLKPFLYTGSDRKKNKKMVTGTLADNQKYSYLSIDKTKATSHLQKCAKEICDEQAIKQAQKLGKLRYCVEKKNIKSVLLKGQYQKTFVEKLDDEKFKVSGLELPAKKQWQRLIECKIEDYKGNQTTLKDCFGKKELVEVDNLKMVNFWRDLSNESGLDSDYLKDNLLKKNDKGKLAKKTAIIPKGVFNKKSKEDDKLKSLENSELLNENFNAEFKIDKHLIPQSSWDKLFKEFFHANKIENNNKHRKIRKDYSLPIVSNPSGGFRIKRRNSMTGEVVYQVSAINGGFACGFAKRKDGSIDMRDKSVTFNPKLKESRNVAYIGKSRNPHIREQQDSDDVESFGNSRECKLASKSILKCELILAEANRIDIKITIDRSIFRQITKFADTDININRPPYKIPIAFKQGADAKNHDKFKEMLREKKIPIPRDSVNTGNKYVFVVQKSNGNYILSYRASLREELKKAYQNGTPINND